MTQEYNDNILLDNDDRRSDFILGFTPGVTLALESSTYRLLAGYNFTAEIFFKEENEGRNDAFSRHNFDLDGTWRVNPQLTLSLTDVFAFSSDTNLLAPEGVATGREEAFSNTLAGSAAYALTRLTSLRGTASWTVLRFDDDEIQDSDVYRVGPTLDHAFTPRLSGSVGYEFGYFDIGGLLTYPLSNVPARFGAWNIHGGADILFFGDMTEAINVDTDGKTSGTKILGLFGIGVSY